MPVLATTSKIIDSASPGGRCQVWWQFGTSLGSMYMGWCPFGRISDGGGAPRGSWGANDRLWRGVRWAGRHPAAPAPPPRPRGILLSTRARREPPTATRAVLWRSKTARMGAAVMGTVAALGVSPVSLAGPRRAQTGRLACARPQGTCGVAGRGLGLVVAAGGGSGA